MSREALSVPAITAAARTEKPWGYELLWAHTGRYAGKILHVDAGGWLSLQYHEAKEETLYLLSGRLRLQLERAEGGWLDRLIEPGTCIHVPAGRLHRITAIEASDVLEASTPELDDVVRVADHYGRAPGTAGTPGGHDRNEDRPHQSPCVAPDESSEREAQAEGRAPGACRQPRSGQPRVLDP